MVKFKHFILKLDEDYKTSEKRFLDQGADPQEVKAAIQFHKDNKNTFKPEWKNIDAIKLLLEYGASKNIKSNDGSTALMIASKAGKSKIKKLLK